MATIVRYPKGGRSLTKGADSTTYVDKAKALVPAAVVSFWIVFMALIKPEATNPSASLLWIVFVVGLVGTWLVENKNLKEAPNYDPKKDKVTGQIVLTSISFAVWVAGLDGGGPFATIPGYLPLYGQIAVAAWTVLLAPNIPVNRR